MSKKIPDTNLDDSSTINIIKYEPSVKEVFPVDDVDDKGKLSSNLILNVTKEGFIKGFKIGFKKGYKKGIKEKSKEVFKEEFKEDFIEEFNEGFNEGLNEGLKKGFKDAFKEDFKEGFNKGLNEGFEEGFEDGFEEEIKNEFEKEFIIEFKDEFKKEFYKNFVKEFNSVREIEKIEKEIRLKEELNLIKHGVDKSIVKNIYNEKSDEELEKMEKFVNDQEYPISKLANELNVEEKVLDEICKELSLNNTGKKFKKR